MALRIQQKRNYDYILIAPHDKGFGCSLQLQSKDELLHFAGEPWFGPIQRQQQVVDLYSPASWLTTSNRGLNDFFTSPPARNIPPPLTGSQDGAIYPSALKAENNLPSRDKQRAKELIKLKVLKEILGQQNSSVSGCDFLKALSKPIKHLPAAGSIRMPLWFSFEKFPAITMDESAQASMSEAGEEQMLNYIYFYNQYLGKRHFQDRSSSDGKVLKPLADQCSMLCCNEVPTYIPDTWEMGCSTVEYSYFCVKMMKERYYLYPIHFGRMELDFTAERQDIVKNNYISH
ncbi:hypothetical protein Anapl_08308 [Anas platyrhynchos]|uniref:Uncharacterized protein n=1 Tax=Anas platyrhynchos TaxID=8839 RepID=R0LN12_ANAPL|nr:hypothetical protein Anapl_08308 [Anas platyrhynchos]